MFTSQLKAVFYDTLFLHLDLSKFEQPKKRLRRIGYPVSAMMCVFVVMKCEDFGYNRPGGLFGKQSSHLSEWE